MQRLRMAPIIRVVAIQEHNVTKFQCEVAMDIGSISFNQLGFLYVINARICNSIYSIKKLRIVKETVFISKTDMLHIISDRI